MKIPSGVTAAAAASVGVHGSSNGSCSAYSSRISNLASSIQPRVLMPAGPAAFYTIDKLPHALATLSPLLPEKLERKDIDLGPNRLAFTIDNVLSPGEADALAACAEAVLELNGHSRLAPGIRTPPGMRNNEAAHWYPSHEAAPKFLGPLWERLEPFVPPTLNALPLHHRLSEKVAQFKYMKGDRFNRHVDGLFPGQGANSQGNGVDEWKGVVSGMSILFYLNDNLHDGLEGGETRLWSADGSRFVDVVPRKGRALLFRRGSPDAVLHAGLPVTGEVPKYMALINLAYGEQNGSEPMRV